jgi:multisubunit Na+/H+ antiporter MnhG subunit
MITIASILSLFFLFTTIICTASAFNQQRKELVYLSFIFLIAFMVFFAEAVGQAQYKRGQIDAIEGKIKYEKVENTSHTYELKEEK